MSSNSSYYHEWKCLAFSKNRLEYDGKKKKICNEQQLFFSPKLAKVRKKKKKTAC